jgi:spermidine/putrescine transport system substrate-binding protein
MRTRLLFPVIALLTAVPLFAQEATPAAIEPWVCPSGFEGQTLSVYNWSSYIADDTVSNFEAACDVSVTYDVYVSNEDLIARLRQGNPGYDIVVPTGYAVETMIAEGLLSPLNFERIPNIANISPDLLDPVFDPGNQYSVPYQWGTIGIAYNVTRVEEPITSWSQMFVHDGPVAWLEDVRGMLGIALNLLGYDPNTVDVDEIAAARDFLIENGDNVVAVIAADSKLLLQNGDIDMAIDYPGNTFQLLADCACEDYAYVIPEEGSVRWMDNVAVPVDAPNQALAEAFIDYLLHPQVAADISNYTAYASPNQAAIDAGLIDEALLNNLAIYPPEDVRANLFFAQANPENEVALNNAWDEIRVALGT